MDIDKEMSRIARDLGIKREASELGIIADTFARYLIGDRDAAIHQLTQLKRADFGWKHVKSA